MFFLKPNETRTQSQDMYCQPRSSKINLGNFGDTSQKTKNMLKPYPSPKEIAGVCESQVNEPSWRWNVGNWCLSSAWARTDSDFHINDTLRFFMDGQRWSKPIVTCCTYYILLPASHLCWDGHMNIHKSLFWCEKGTRVPEPYCLRDSGAKLDAAPSLKLESSCYVLLGKVRGMVVKSMGLPSGKLT